jgi:FkbM family methyltransferase
MIVNTRRLFLRLLRSIPIDAVGDIGSMNGAESLVFHRARPRARIYAFEPNPYNFRLLARDRAVTQCGIRVFPLAATNRDGEAEFFIVGADYSRVNSRRGMSSLHCRPDEWAPAEVTHVKTRRLDTFFRAECPPSARLALWIDGEGKAYEIAEGMTGVARQVRLLHIEVESAPCISPDQRLYPAVKSLLQELGFTELATDQAPSVDQFNALFVRADLPRTVRLRIAAWRLHAVARRLAGDAARKIRRNSRFGFVGG